MAQTPEEPEFDIEVEDDLPEIDRGKSPMPENIVQKLEDDELEDFSKEKAKQLKKVWHDERRAKESALREREEAVNVARRLIQENQALKRNLNVGEQVYVGTAKQSADSEMELAKRAFKEAYDSGDGDKVADAQVLLTGAKLKLQQIENYVPQYNTLQDDKNRVDKTASKDEWSVTPVAEQAPQIDPKAAAWQKRNAWFGDNDVMTSLAFGLHANLIKEGVDPTSDEYYAHIDKELRHRFPEEFEDEKPTKRKTQTANTVVAGVKRSTAPRKIVLTSTQVSLAKKFGITPEQYARELVKIGDYNV